MTSSKREVYEGRRDRAAKMAMRDDDGGGRGKCHCGLSFSSGLTNCQRRKQLMDGVKRERERERKRVG